jgi:hypothetical protein
MITQLNPSIPVLVTSKDNAKGMAIGWVDYSQEHNLIWIVALDNSEIWCVPNPEIRMQKNWTMGRK